jgi:transposase-like protein
MAMNASGMRDTARVVQVSTNTVMTALKKTTVRQKAKHPQSTYVRVR